MYTETDLREALQFSAARADELIAAELSDAAVAPRSGGDVLELSDARRHHSRFRVWLPVAAAAAVVAAVGAGMFVASGSGGDGSKHDAAASQGVSVASQPPVTHAHAAVSLANLITVTETSEYGYQFGPASLPQVWTVSGATPVNVIAMSSSTPFDPATQITDAEQVQVAGTTGYYGKVSAHLQNPAADEGKYGPPKATLAWQAANGTWIFIQGENAFVDLSLSTLMTRYPQLGITATPTPLPPLPYRAGWLPDDLTVTSLAWQPTDAVNYYSEVTLTEGTNSVQIGVSHGQPTTEVSAEDAVHGPHLSAPDPHATRIVGQGATRVSLTVIVHGYPQATAQRILDNLDLSKLDNDRATWWAVTDAFNS